MIHILQNSAMLLPVQKGIMLSKPTVATELIRFDNGKRVSPFYKKIVPQEDFYISPLGAILRAKDLKGYLAGFSLGTNYELGTYASRIYFSYALASSSQKLDTQSTDTTGHLFQAGFLNRYAYNVFEMTMNTNVSLGFFKIDNEWQNNAMFDSTADFGNYQLNLGLSAGVKLGDKLSFKPFVGMQHYIQMQEGFKQNGGLGLESKAYNAYIIDGVLGIETRYVYDRFISLFGQFSFENKLYNTHKNIFMRVLDNELKYENQSYDHVLNLNVGARLLTWYKIALDAEFLYKHYNSGLNYYGGNLSLKYLF